ncbi:hypothetical protein XENTR_v10023703 [Xenopus tropicalis]|nr:hypothetical protein XENTR_v10023703 [Xenopus tropicalis]
MWPMRCQGVIYRWENSVQGALKKQFTMFSLCALPSWTYSRPNEYSTAWVPHHCIHWGGEAGRHIQVPSQSIQRFLSAVYSYRSL